MSNGKPISHTQYLLARMEAKYLSGGLVRMSHDNQLYKEVRAAGNHVVDVTWVSDTEKSLEPQLREMLKEKAYELACKHPAGLTRGTLLHAYHDLLEAAPGASPLALILYLYPQASPRPQLKVVK